MLDTTKAVIDMLGGIHAVARLTDRTYDAVWLWRKNGRFPANTYLLLAKALRDAGHKASDSLWFGHK